MARICSTIDECMQYLLSKLVQEIDRGFVTIKHIRIKSACFFKSQYPSINTYDTLKDIL